MERLTRKVDGKIVFPSELVGVTLTPDNVVLHELLCRLADYEDTGLTLEQCETAKVIIESTFSNDTSKVERIRELLKADQDGRLVVLPCKVGDTVYRLQYIEQTPGRFVVGVAEIKFALIWLEEFGNTVFLTREEAEKALEAMTDG